MNPQSLPEWGQYVQTLAGSALRSKAIAVNSQRFLDLYRDQDGFTTGDVRQIILYFVRQLVATGQKIPEGGAYDMVKLARLDDVARTSPILPELAVRAMALAVIL